LGFEIFENPKSVPQNRGGYGTPLLFLGVGQNLEIGDIENQ
jgi:hypothetical protein